LEFTAINCISVGLQIIIWRGKFMLWRIETLLGKNLETNNETTAVAMQQLDKHATKTIELLSWKPAC
jgi:hypothetical protein